VPFLSSPFSLHSSGWLARRNETSVDEVLTRELEDVACAHAEELAAAVPGFAEALAWPAAEG
jgi:hypothetical protein